MAKYELNAFEIATLLRNKRLEKKISQKDLAEKCDIPPGRLGAIEAGKHTARFLTIETLGKLCEHLDINVRHAIDIIYYRDKDRTKLLIDDEQIKKEFNLSNAVVNKETLKIILFLYEMTKGLLSKNEACNCEEKYNDPEPETTRIERDYC